jgi:signal transduction histidine kinase
LQRHLDELPAEERHTMLTDAYGETLRLAELVEELLLLARADASVDKVLAAHISFFNRFGNSQRIINRMYRQWQPL